MENGVPRIAIPMPHSSDRKYGERAIPQYERAVALAGGEPVRVPLDRTRAEVLQVIARCDGVLLPGSNADVDPAKFHAARSPHTADADARRDAVDDLLLENAYKLHKPVLGICYGLQSLNVFRKGSLVQHIPDFLPEKTRGKVDHGVGKKAAIAHTVEIDANSTLAQIVRSGNSTGAATHAHTRFAALETLRHPRLWFDRLRHGIQSRRGGADPRDHRKIIADGNRIVVPVNSSHHQSADAIGEGLRVVARCPDDGIIEAVEGTSTDHFVLAVQWHPERSVTEDRVSLAIFRALVEVAAARR